MFCLPQYIDTSAAIIFRDLHGEDCPRGLHRDAFTRRLAYYLGEDCALHPFREGNGRTQRAFFTQLARDAGYTLAWQHLDAARNIEASTAIMRGDPRTDAQDARHTRQGQHLTARYPPICAVSDLLVIRS